MFFEPDYQNLVLAARNLAAPRPPLYEHVIHLDVIERITGQPFAPLLQSGDPADLREFFRLHSDFYRQYGFDAVSFECNAGSVMPGSGHLGGHGLSPGISGRDDFVRYPWDEIEDRYFRRYAP
jgi:uroporphyrinogen decarboxylase